MTHIQININSIPTEITPPPEPIQLYQLKEDREVLGGIRSCASCPAVFTLKDDPHVVMTEQWQYYLRAINYNMTVNDVYLLLDKSLAFANGTGFRNPNDPRADYFHRINLNYPPPNLDKVRSCSRSVVTGVEQFSLAQSVNGLKTMLPAFLSGKKPILSSGLASKNVLKVKTFDSTKPPPLKQGRSYPTRIEDVNPNDYLYLPQYNREMFLVATIVNPNGTVVQFPRGGLYSWTNDNTPYTFMPHISNPDFGDVVYPLDYLTKLPLGSSVPSPYRRS